MLPDSHFRGLQLHHFGFAVKSIEAHINTCIEPFFAEWSVSDPVIDAIQQVRIAFVEAGGGRIELVEPLGLRSPVCKYVNERRGSLYHVCYETDKLDQTISHFRNAGALLVSGPTPAAALNNRHIAFLYMPSWDLLELVEKG